MPTASGDSEVIPDQQGLFGDGHQSEGSAVATKGRSPTYEFVWSVEPPSEPFHVFKYCPRCRAPRCFRCAYKFRVNANRKFIDIWLLFDCTRCGATAKLPVVRRLPASRIGQSRLRAFEGNDRNQAMAIARDRRLLKRAGFSVESQRPVIEGPQLGAGDVSARAGQSRALLVFRGPEMALEPLLPALMSVSRHQAERLLVSGAIRCGPPSTLPSGERAIDLVIEWDAMRRIVGHDYEPSSVLSGWSRP